MPATAQKSPPAYLREARLEAGYVSRGTAATAVPYSPETIGRHERGDVEMEPSDIVTYAKCYNRPDLMYRYCADCPVGQQLGRKAEDRNLPFAALRFHRLIRESVAMADRLEEIAYDGVVDAMEMPDFQAAIGHLQKLADGITDIILIGLGKGMAASGATESGRGQAQK